MAQKTSDQAVKTTPLINKSNDEQKKIIDQAFKDALSKKKNW